uniref:Uncharacterized protein n=1 Tax=Panagrolaimus davidi TaxID=227884 RepID=A0A914QGI6_9BILA
MILDASIAFFRSNFPRKIIFTHQNSKKLFLDEEILIRNGFYICNENYSVFPPINFDTEIIQALAEEDKDLKNIQEKVIKVLEIFYENEKFGRNIFQEQFEPYFWRHCFKEPLFLGIRNAATKFFIATSSKPISLESFNQGNLVFSLNSVVPDDQTTIKWCSKLFSSIKCRLNAYMNSGIFVETPQQYRQLFAIVCYEIAKLLIFQNNFCSALQILDEGIMKGIQFDDNNLGKLAFCISSKLPSLPKIKVCQSLYPIPKPAPNSRQIPCLIRPSLEEFLQYLDRPIVIKDFVKHFPLYEFFDFDYLNDVHGYRRVPIEFGSSYAGEDYSQKIVTIHEYLRDYLTLESSAKSKF